MYSAVYVSEVVPETLGRDPEALQAALAALQATSDANNRRSNVRGLLVCGHDYFLQWLQGEESRVRALLERIATDPRHRSMQVVHTGPCDAELDAWSMTLLSRAATDPQVDDVLRNLRDGRLPPPGPGPGGVPAAIVRRLVKPGPPDGVRQRVGLFGQNGVWSGALMAHLESKWGSPLYRTRLLGSLGLERAALIEHLDHDDPEHGPLTVVNYSGDLLSASWMQGCLAPLGAAALVFSGTTEEGVAGFARQVLAQLGPANAQARLVCLFGRTAARFLPAAQEVLGASGHDVLYSAVPLADSTAVWQEITRSLDRVAPAEEAVVPAPVVVAPAPEPQPQPQPEPGPAMVAPPAAATPDTVPAPAASPAAALPVPEAMLELLLGIEGVAAVGWCPPDTDQGAVLRAHAGADAQALQREFSAWCGQPRPGADTEQLLVRWSDRLTLLRPADAAGSLYYLASAPGFLNETWLRVQVDAALQPPAGAA